MIILTLEHSTFTQSSSFSISVWIQPNQVKLQTILMAIPDRFADRFNAMAYYSHNGVSSTIWDFGDCTSGGRLIFVGTTFQIHGNTMFTLLILQRV